MKTDRELTELAAKAIGIKPDDFSQDGTAFFGRARWNPLADDGDALRLAVKLGLKIEHHDDSVVVWDDYCGTGYIPYEGDADKATRRAIVLAAAEIGEEMP